MAGMTGWKAEGSGRLGAPPRPDEACACACVYVYLCVCAHVCVHLYMLGGGQAPHSSPGLPHLTLPAGSTQQSTPRPQASRACPLYGGRGLAFPPCPGLGLGLISCPHLPSKQLHSTPNKAASPQHQLLS